MQSEELFQLYLCY